MMSQGPQLMLNPNGALATIASGAAFSLVVMAMLSSVIAALPPRLLDPQWQLTLGGALTSNGPLALMGLVLLHLAVFLRPDSSRLSKRLTRWRQLAVLVALLYLLLIPLELSSSWSAINTARNLQTRSLRETKTRVQTFRLAIDQASSSADLQRRLAAVGGPNLPPAMLQQPLNQLRPILLRQLQSSASLTRTRTDTSLEKPLTALVLEAIRVVGMAILLALGFASGATGTGTSDSLIDRLKILRPGRSR
jgi:hypothetical protein